MSKDTTWFDLMMSFARQYWKYKNSDSIINAFVTFALLIGLPLVVSKSFFNLLVSFEFLGAEFAINDNEYALVGIGIILVSFVGIIWRVVSINKKLTGILILHRGMEGMRASNAQDALPKSFSRGKLDIVDIYESNQLSEGEVISPKHALTKIKGIDQLVSTRLQGVKPSEVQLAYAGLAPIPLLVTAGYKVSSRQNCLVLEYDRLTNWHSLDDADDQETLKISEPHEVTGHQVAIILPFSVEITEPQIPMSFAGKAYVMQLENGARVDSLNSEAKQKRIVKQFYNLCASLKAKHPSVTEIHIFMACQASFAFRLGQIITTSVMPTLLIYQYDVAKHSYSWNVKIENGREPEVIEVT
jgi:hypothetical protein